MKKHFIPLLFVLPIILTACGGGAGKESKEIRIDGSSTVFPITEAVAEEFRGEQSDVKVTVGVSGTGGGFKKFVRNEIDICNASRPIKQSEAEEAEKNDIQFIELPVAFDGLAVIVHPENDWVDYFTVAELKKIWEPSAQGEVKRWNQIRPEWPNEELRLYGPGIASGTYDYFTEAVVGKSGSSRGDFTASEDDNVLVQGVSSDKYALGFFGLAYYEENSDALKLVPIDDEKNDNGDGPIYPTMETVSNGTYQPLARPIFIYVTDKAAQDTAVNDFVNFYLDNAAELSEEVGYIPLPAEAYTLAKVRFNNGKTGSSFQDHAVGVKVEELLKNGNSH